MKWIGQHIWDFVSRFRNDVYFEGLTETEETRGLVVDANGKVSINPLSGDEHATHVYENVRNDEGATIPVGTPVYSKGEIGGSERIKVGIADASDPAKMPAIGITNTELTTTGDTKDGLITLVGVYNTNLSGFSGVSENDIVYVAVGGGLTITKPTGANLIQNVGIVLKTNGPGTIIQGLAVTCIGRTNDVPTPLYIDHANQRVGVGVTNPTELLEVYKNGGDVAIKVHEDAGTHEAKIHLRRGGSDWELINNNDLAIESEGTELFRIKTSGNVGIGTSTPDSLLELKSSSLTDFLKLTSGGSSANPIKLIFEKTGSEQGIIEYNRNGDLEIYNTDSDGGVMIDGSASGGSDLYVSNSGNTTLGGRADFQKDFRLRGTDAAANQGVVRFYVDSSNKLFIDTANDGSNLFAIDGSGNVGIGTTSPTNKLHVIGNTRIEGDLTVNGTYTQIDTDVNTTEQWLVTNDGTGPAAVINQLGSEDIFDVQDDGTSVFYVEDGGNIGIGTTSPGKRLDIRTNGVGDGITLTTSTPKTFAQIINGNSETFPYGKLTMNYGDTTPVQIVALSNELQLSGGYNTTGGKISFRIATSERMRLTDTGLGIGTTSPSSQLEISKDSDDGTDSPTFSITNASTTLNDGADIGTIQFKNSDLSGSGPHIATIKGVANSTDERTAELAFSTCNVSSTSEAMRIDSSGNVGIGTTSPSYTLDVGGEIKSDGYRIDLSATTQRAISSTGTDSIQFGDAGVNEFKFKNAAGTSVLINSSGNVGIGTTSPSELLTIAAESPTLRFEDISSSNYTEMYVNNFDTYLNTNGRFFIQNQGSTKVTFKSDGNVGIGTTNPSEKLEVSGNIAVSGSVQKQISTTHHTFTTVNGGSSTQDYWVPFIGTNELASPNVTHRTIAPYGGILKKAIVHSTAAFGASAQVRFHRIDNGTASVFTNDNSTDDVTTNVTRSLATAYTSSEFIFATGNTFSAGDQIGVSLVRDNTAQGDVAMTLVWEYELF